jgi:hypothetical protein
MKELDFVFPDNQGCCGKRIGSLLELGTALEKAWSKDTSADPEHWSLENPAWGQCAVTALLVQDLFGGDLRRAVIKGISHYWNILSSGELVDLTIQQFGELSEGRPEGEPRTREYALSGQDVERRYLALKRRVFNRLDVCRNEDKRDD